MPAIRRGSRSRAGLAACAEYRTASPRGTSSALFAAAAAVVSALWLLPNAAALEGPAETGKAAAGAQGRATTPVTITDSGFSPQTVTITVGDTVTWTNNGPSPHTTSSDTGVWDSVSLFPAGIPVGQSFSFTFATAGTYPYHCTIFPSLTGTVVVNAAPGPPSITSSLTASGTVGIPLSYTITANGTAPIAFSVANLPAWLSLAGAVLSGTATAAGTFNVTLVASNNFGTDTKTLVISISASTANQVVMPVFSPGPGTYPSAQTVTITCATPGATIFYTVDGSIPTIYSSVYSAPISIGANTTLEAFATAPGMTNSPVQVGTYTILASGGGFTSAGTTTFTYGGTLTVGGGGPDIVPVLTQDTGGGTPPVTVTFDPTKTYLPVLVDPNTGNNLYNYTAIWDFGDATGVVIGGLDGTTPDQALAIVGHDYDGVNYYTVTFRIDITVVNPALAATSPGHFSKGPSAFTTGQVHTATANFPPTPQLTVLSSPASGTLPYLLQITPSTSFDGDGYLVWAAIDWGDGSFGLLTPLPPSFPLQVLKHTYVTPGIYRVTLSVIDNGRLTRQTQLPPKPDPRDPDAALQVYIQASLGNVVTDTSLLDPKYNPQLRQTSVLVQVPGNMIIQKGQFQVNFTRASADTFNLQLQPSLFPDSLANASVQFTLGSGATPLALPAFLLDRKGRYTNQALGFTFAFDGRKRALLIKLTHAKLAAAFGLADSTAVNANVDVPVSVVFNNNLTLGTTARFVYNAKAGSKGVGKNGHSYPDGN